MIVFDGHNDTLLKLYETFRRDVKAFIRGSTQLDIDLPRAQKGELVGGLFALYTPPMPSSPERDPLYGVTFTENGYDTKLASPIDQTYASLFTDALIDTAYRLQAASKGAIRIVVSTYEIEILVERGVLVMVLHIEGAEAIKPDLSNLEDYYRKGVRSLGIVWSRPNAFGHGVPFRFPGSPDTGEGLTDPGKALVRACNELGIMVDLAHLNEKGFYDVAAISTAPLVVTHTDVHAICPSTRNVTDAQIDTIAASGGVIGINFERINTHPRSSDYPYAPLEQVTDHIDYIADRVGIDHVAFGSDFDGAMMPRSLKDASRLPHLIDNLKERGYDKAALEKFAYRNWLRVFDATWKY